MLTVLGRASSSNVQVAMWAVGELDLTCERRDVGGRYGGNDMPEYRAMNPMGLVPVLIDGDVVMFESCAILRYLGARYGDGAFWPEDPALRGPLDSWAEWSKTTFAPAVMPLFWGLVRTAPSKRDVKAMQRAAAAIAPLARMLDARIGAGPWLAGPAFSFADIVAGHQLNRYFSLDFEREETPALRAYWERLKERPAYREHAMASWAELEVRD
jgi:glutathione S-transferase